MRKRKTPLELFSLSFLDCICCGLGAVLIVLLLYVREMQRQQNSVPPLRAHIAVLSNDIVNLNTRISTLSSAAGSYTNTIVALSNALTGLQVQIASQSKELRLAKDANRILGDLGGAVTQQMALIHSLSNQLLQVQGTKTILGIPIAEKKLVFLLDLSASMKDDQRLADVKGAFKVMLASLTPDYAIDLCYFSTLPQTNIIIIRQKWGALKPIADAGKVDCVQFVTALEPLGGTPTTAAMRDVFKRYPAADAVILLSDGEPNDRTTWHQCADEIARANTRKIPVYTVGVGSLMADATSPGRQFMETVARDSNGACIAF